jgi:hypothetical protein
VEKKVEVAGVANAFEPLPMQRGRHLNYSVPSLQHFFVQLFPQPVATP